MEHHYPIRAVAKITGLSLDTLRAWERRYQAVVPERTERGRQYGREHIERLLLLRQLVQQGHAIGGIAGLNDGQLRNLLAKSESSHDVAPKFALIAPVLAAIENYDAARAGDELSRLAAILAPRDLVYEVAAPVMREVGSRWHAGTMTIAQEHLVSQLLRNVLGSMMRLVRPVSAATKIILGTPLGETHEFGILAAAMLASLAGIEPVYLGPNLPAEEIAGAAERSAASVIVLGLTFPTASTPGEIRKIAAAMAEGTELWLGGNTDGLDLGNLALANAGRRTVVLPDLPAFENECRRLGN